MGSSGEDPNKGIDPTAGGLVWVRRRNGAWWPGKILGPDEVPEGCVPTPRAGTPVKLLGRDDASVDWYNLEKSKRVKAFHCKEYNDCIKKVKASASHPSKRAAKYARREDAILHALELENARLGKDHTDLSAAPDAPDAEEHCHADESPSASHSSEDENLNTSGDDLGSGLEVSHSSASFDGPDHVDSANGPENESDDDGSEGVKRMRGLEDLGMGVTSPLKRKRAQAGPVHEFLKRKNRHRPLTKVMECATMVSAPQFSVPTESNELKKNSSVPINNNSNSNGVSDENRTLPASRHVSDASETETVPMLFGVPLVADGKNSAGLSSFASDAAKRTQVVGGAQSSQSNHVEEVARGNENDGATRSGTFQWRLKGKRSRSRKVDLNNEPEPYVTGVDREITLASPNRNVDPNNVGGPFASDIGGHRSKSRSIAAEPLVPPRLLPYRLSRLTVNPKYDDSEYSLAPRNAISGLYDVNLEVKVGYRPQHVPYISLMSKLTGRPIIGHPLTIGLLKDGSSDQVISKYESSLTEPVSASESARKRRGRPPTKRGGSLSKTRRNGLLSKKTRKLSSLTGSHRLSREVTKKPVLQKLKGPSIACVPLKIVFSRINAALTSSIRAAPRSSPTAE